MVGYILLIVWNLNICRNIIFISFPSVISIEERAFNRCASLKVIKLPSLIRTGKWACGNCPALVKVSIPNCEIIENGTFLGCENLERIKLDNVEEIAFGLCGSLKLINMPSVKRIGYSAFNEYRSLHTITIALNSVMIPNNKSVDYSHFYLCDALRTLHLIWRGVEDEYSNALQADGNETITLDLSMLFPDTQKSPGEQVVPKQIKNVYLHEEAYLRGDLPCSLILTNYGPDKRTATLNKENGWKCVEE